MPDTDKFTDLQNLFYNQLTAVLGLNGEPFQLWQPSTPLVTGANTADSNNDALWDYFNVLPAYSLTNHFESSGGAEFFSNYANGLLNNLSPADTNLTKDLPNPVLMQFQHHLRGIKPKPAARNYGQLFRQWAESEYPQYANIGMSDYDKLVLDTVGEAQMAVMPYAPGGGAKPPPLHPDWNKTYADLTTALAGATGVTFDSSQLNQTSDVSSTWTKGANSGFMGLWGGSSESSSISQQFAETSVELSGSFAHVMRFEAEPGAWYSSACLGDAWAHSTGAPWSPDAANTWSNYFDPDTGELARFVTDLVVASGLNFTVKSEVQLSADDQTAVTKNSSAGMWPFYTQGGGSGANTKIDKLDDTGLTVTITSDTDVPLVIGAIVQPVEHFTSHGGGAGATT